MFENEFQNREDEVQRVCWGSDVLLNITGETGIGKSRLIERCVQVWMRDGAPAQIFQVDLQELNDQSEGLAKSFLNALVKQGGAYLEGVWNSEDQFAAFVVQRILSIAQSPTQVPGGQAVRVPPRVVLIVDTTEVVPNNQPFWDWLEKNLLRPLINEKRIKMIFSGQMPIKWQDFEVRRHSEEPIRLEPLNGQERDSPARAMIRNLFSIRNQEYDLETRERLVQIILNLSSGHPRLIEMLVDHLAKLPITTAGQETELALCKQVIEPFIVKEFYQSISEEWQDLLWWISILDEFDIFFLKIYLGIVLSKDYEKRQDYFYLTGIRTLHEHAILRWETGRGETFQGVVGKIIRKCFSVTRRDDFIKANQAAAQAYNRKKELDGGEGNNNQDDDRHARIYMKRASMEAA